MVFKPGLCASRTVAWTPAQLDSAQLLQWLDAPDASTVTLNGTTVSQINDKSGNARHGAQSVAANQPIYVTSESINYMNYEGSIDYLTSPSVANTDGVTSFFVFATAHVSQDLLRTATRYAFRLWNVNTQFATPNNPDTVYRNGNLVNVTNSVEGLAEFARGTMNIQIGEMRGMDYSNPGWAADWDYGAASAGFQFEGRMYEIIHLAADTPIEDILRMEGYLAWKYGLEAELPASHPYRNAAPTIPGVRAWTPLNMSAQALRQWIDATNEGTVSLNAGNISEIADSSGNGYSATQTTAADQPGYIDGSAGFKAIDFGTPAGGNLNLGIPTNDSDAIVFMVMKESTNSFIPVSSGTGRVLCICTQGSTSTVLNDAFTGDFDYYKNGNAVLPLTRNDLYDLYGQDQLVILEGRGPDLTNWTIDWNLGSFNASFDLEGEVYEFIVMSSSATLDELLRTEGYLAHKYNLQSQLPSAHPYKTVAPTTSAPVYTPFNDGATVILDFQDTSSVTLNGTNISTVANQASTEFGDFEQTNAVQQPLYNTNDSDAGGFRTMDTDNGTSAKIGLEAQDEITFGDVYFVMTYKDGTDATFDSFANLISDPGTTANRILGNSGTANLFTGTVFTSEFEVNGAAASNTVLPMPFSIVRASNATAGTGALDLFFDENNGTRDWEGSLAYMVVFPEQLDAAANTRVLNYLSNKFNITLS